MPMATVAATAPAPGLPVALAVGMLRHGLYEAVNSRASRLF